MNKITINRELKDKDFFIGDVVIINGTTFMVVLVEHNDFEYHYLLDIQTGLIEQRVDLSMHSYEGALDAIHQRFGTDEIDHLGSVEINIVKKV